jgi:outer membrane protein
MVRYFLFAILILGPALAAASSDVLDLYIEEALENNLALKQREFSLERSLAALAEARGLFLPSVDLTSRYTRAGGGRTVDIPVGDLVNPIYMTLNELLQENRFPTNLPNISEPFIREEEQESRVRIAQPIFQPSVYFNYRIRSSLASAERAARDRYRQHLVRDVKVAYFNYLKTLKLVDLYVGTELLLKENLRVSESLFKNEKATMDVVFRARAELSHLEQEKLESARNRDLARAYFNLLLNRSLDTTVEVVDAQEIPRDRLLDRADIETEALGRRYELMELRFGIEAAKHGVRLSKAGFLPNLVAAYDYGYLGEGYRFNDEHDFWMGSLVLEWNLFSGLQRKARIDRARAEERRLEAQIGELERMIALEVRRTYDDLVVAEKSIASAEARLKSAEKTFDIVSKKYREGISPQIEFIDARTMLTQAEINLIVTTYDYHIRYAELERAAAMYEVDR